MSAIYIENLTCTECGNPFQGALEQNFPPELIRVGTCPSCFDKRSINLKFITFYPSGDTRTEMRFLPEAEASFVMKVMLDRIFKAEHLSEENYKLFIEGTGKSLSANETLEQAGIQAGDMILLLRTYSFTCEECGKEWEESAIEAKQVVCPVCETQPKGNPEFTDGVLYNPPQAGR